MSGIAGIYRRDGASAGDGSVRAMLDTMPYRGPDRSGVWSRGEAGLGHAMLCTTPESLEEQLPLWHPASGLAITADARIDNRDELLGALGLANRNDMGDGEIILRTYDKWGERCPDKLAGDFAFAIWDERKRRLFCARDQMGIKCLYYFVSPKTIAFASEIKALCALDEIPARLNELRILDYLANIFEDRAITFYKDIYRLPAASTLTVTPYAARTARYWTLDPTKELKLRSDGEYAEAFRECFQTAVKRRLRSAFPTGAALSGGLDSSSIASTARKLRRDAGIADPLRSFSLIFPSMPREVIREIDEREYICEVLKQGGLEPTFVEADRHSPLGDVGRVHRHLDEAFFAGNLYLHWAMYQAARQQNVRVFLDGLDGDTTVSHGLEYLGELAVRGRWKTLRTEVGLLAKRMNTDPRNIVREYCIKPFCPTWMYSTWRRLHGRPTDAGIPQNFLKDEFSARLRLKDRVAEMVCTKRACFTGAREKHHAMIMFPLYAHALEVSDKASAAFGVEARYPFFDKRLIELCLSLPAGQKFQAGWSRSILRRAMAGILPEAVRWRASKANLSPNFYIRLLAGDREVLDEVILADAEELKPYVNMNSIRAAYTAYRSNPLRSHADSVNIFSAVNLALWLRTTGVRP